MTGRHRKNLADCIRRKANAPTGYSSIYAARQADRNTASSAAKLREVMAAYGTRVEVTWTPGEVCAVLGPATRDGLCVTRTLCRSWEARGWIRMVSRGPGRSWLEVEIEALPEAPQ